MLCKTHNHEKEQHLGTYPKGHCGCNHGCSDRHHNHELHRLWTILTRIKRANTKKARKCFEVRSLIRKFDFVEVLRNSSGGKAGVLSLRKSQINLDFRSLIRNFAAET